VKLRRESKRKGGEKKNLAMRVFLPKITRETRGRRRKDGIKA